MVENSLLDIIRSVDDTVRGRESGESHSLMFVREQVFIPSQSLSLKPQEIEFDTRTLEDVALGMITDYTMYTMDRNHRTALLKNTNFPGAMLLDGVMRHLSQYRFLKCVVIDKGDLVFQFVDPLAQ